MVLFKQRLKELAGTTLGFVVFLGFMSAFIVAVFVVAVIIYWGFNTLTGAEVISPEGAGEFAIRFVAWGYVGFVLCKLIKWLVIEPFLASRRP